MFPPLLQLSHTFLNTSFLIFFLDYQERVSPGTHFVEQVGPKLTEICLPLPLSSKVKSMHHHLPDQYFFEQTRHALAFVPHLRIGSCVDS